MIIRPAVPSDVAQILRFIQGLAEYEKLAHEVEATEVRLASTLFPRSGPAAAECILVFDGSEAAGFALFFPTYSTFLARPGLYLEDLYVIPKKRGMGFGRAMMLHLAGLANVRGCGRMEWSVLAWNESAIGFYEKLGARRLQEWTTCRLDGSELSQYA